MTTSKSLPPRPSLESLRKQAKKLARDIDAGHSHRLAGRRHALQRPCVRGARRPAGSNPIAFGDLILKRNVPITKAAAEDTGDHFQARWPNWPATGRCVRVMNDVVGSEDLVGDRQLPVCDDVTEPTAGSGLLLFD